MRICLAFGLDRLRQDSVSDPDLTLGMIIGLSSVFIREVIDHVVGPLFSNLDDLTSDLYIPVGVVRVGYR